MLFLLCFCFLSFSLATPKPWCEPSTLKSASKTIALAGGGIAATSTALGWWLSAQRDTAKKEGHEARYNALTRLMEGVRSLRNISFFTGVAGAAAYFYFDKNDTTQINNTSPSSDNSTTLTPAHSGSGTTGGHTAPLTTVVLDDKTTDPKTYTYQRFEFDEESWRAAREACKKSQQPYERPKDPNAQKIKDSLTGENCHHLINEKQITLTTNELPETQMSFTEWYKKGIQRNTYALNKGHGLSREEIEQRHKLDRYYTIREKHLQNDQTAPPQYYRTNETTAHLIRTSPVENSEDMLCTFHSLAKVLTGQDYLGDAFSRWFGQINHNISQNGHHGFEVSELNALIANQLGLIPFILDETRHNLSIQIPEEAHNNYFYDPAYGIILHLVNNGRHMQTAEELDEEGNYKRNKAEINKKMLADRIDAIKELLTSLPDFHKGLPVTLDKWTTHKDYLRDFPQWDAPDEVFQEFHKPDYYFALSNNIWMHLSMFILAKGADVGVMLESGESLHNYLERLEHATPIDDIDMMIHQYRMAVTPFIKTQEDARNLLLMHTHASEKPDAATYSFQWLDIRKDQEAFDLQEKIASLPKVTNKIEPLRRRNSFAGLYTEGVLPRELSLQSS